jgi:hypothetical protein
LQIVGAGDAAPAVVLVTATISADSAAHAYSQETFMPIDLLPLGAQPDVVDVAQRAVTLSGKYRRA